MSGNINNLKAESSPSILRVALPNVNFVLDPHTMEDAYSMLLVLQIHRGLLRYSPSGEVVEDIAKSWSIDSTNTHYKIKLRQTQFSDGSPILARHVVNSFARLFLKNGSFSADLSYVKGSTDFRKTKDLSKLGIKALKDDEVLFELNHPSALFLKHLATVDAAVLKLESFEENPTFNQKSGHKWPIPY